MIPLFQNAPATFAQLPRAIRNNNPGDIRAEPGVTWDGQVGVDPDGFCVFSHTYWGLRAMCIILYRYNHDEGHKTLAEIITRWAPPSRNNTQEYIVFVSNAVHLDKAHNIDVVSDMQQLLTAICEYESGKQWVSHTAIHVITNDFTNSLQEAPNHG